MAESDGELDYKELVSAHNRKHKKAGGWQAMGLDTRILRGIKKKGYRAPTPIQRKAIPIVQDGKDVVAMARTGSGKTAAFLIPLLQRLKTPLPTPARALLLSPTRELALQTFRFLKDLGKHTGLRAAVLVGGDSLEEQFQALHSNPDILIATPGRLLHVVVEMNLKLSSIQYVVFDEADRLFEMGFADQLKDVLRRLPESRQTLLFSATLPKVLVDFARAGLSQPVLLRLDLDTKISENLDMVFLSCRQEDKVAAFLHLLRHVLDVERQQTIVFCATKHHVEYVKGILEASRFDCSYLYSSMDPIARKINVTRFRNRETNLLVVTDIAARGVDIPLLDNAVNFHFPAKPKLFVHRVGRVARAGQKGRALSLVCPDELPYLIDMFLFLGRSIQVVNFSQDSSVSKDTSDFIGSIPQTVIDTEIDSLNSVLSVSHDLVSEQKVTENAMKNYLKSRPLASAESVRRVKKDEGLKALISAPESHPHPLFPSAADSSAVTLLKQLRSYKPQLTAPESHPHPLFPSAADSFAVTLLKQLRSYKPQLTAPESHPHPLFPSAADSSAVTLLKQLRSYKPQLTAPESHPHPLFLSAADSSAVTLLKQLRSYKPQLTVFEMNTSNKHDEWVVMKRKRRKHEKFVKSKTTPTEMNTAPDNVEMKEETVKDEVDEMDLKDAFSTVIIPKFHEPTKESIEIARQKKMRKSAARADRLANKKSATQEYENSAPKTKVFIPYRPADFHAEQGLAVERGGFDAQAKELVLDFTADEEKEMRKQRRGKVWDRKKKKFVSSNAGQDEQKMKKIRTENGTLVPASFQSGRYGRWVKKQRIDAQDSDEGESAADTSSGHPQWKSRGRQDPNAALNQDRVGGNRVGGSRIGGNRVGDGGGCGGRGRGGRLGIKTKEQILKVRSKKERVQSYQKYREDSNRKGRPGAPSGGGKRGRGGGSRGRGGKRR